jgi:hypothetical protein
MYESRQTESIALFWWGGHQDTEADKTVLFPEIVEWPMEASQSK